MAIAVKALALAVAAAACVIAQAPGLDAFLSQLQRATAANDAAAIAAMVRYPIAISIGGFRVPIANPDAFVERYDDIFTEPLRESVARASVSNGALTGTTDVVITEVDGHLRITAIVVPTVIPGAQANAAEPSSRSPSGAQNQAPRRVVIRVGPQPTQIPGRLGVGATDSLIVYLPKGRVAGIRLERIRVGAAVLRVTHARTGVPLNARTSSDARFTSGTPAEGSDYRIEVRRTGAADEGPLPYMVSVTLR